MFPVRKMTRGENRLSIREAGFSLQRMLDKSAYKFPLILSVVVFSTRKKGVYSSRSIVYYL